MSTQVIGISARSSPSVLRSRMFGAAPRDPWKDARQDAREDTRAPTPAAQPAYGLTRREREVLGLLVLGLTKRKMAERLYLSVHTIDTHVRRIYSKLGVHSAAAAVFKALHERLI